MLSRIRTERSSWSCSQAVSKPVWLIPLVCVQWKTPDDGQRNCQKHVEFYSKNKFEKLVHLVGFIIIIFHDARSPERQTLLLIGVPKNVDQLMSKICPCGEAHITEEYGVSTTTTYIYMSVVVQLRPLYSIEEVPNLYANCLDERVCRNRASCCSLKLSFHPISSHFTSWAMASLLIIKCKETFFPLPLLARIFQRFFHSDSGHRC